MSSEQKNNDASPVKPTDKKTTPKSSNQYSRWLWLGMLVVILSIAFSSYMVYFGTDNLIAKLMIIPQLAFAIIVAIYKFVK